MGDIVAGILGLLLIGALVVGSDAWPTSRVRGMQSALTTLGILVVILVAGLVVSLFRP